MVDTPATAFRDVTFEAEDGERLHGWWVPAPGPSLGPVLLCHGNAGNVGDRVPHAALLTEAGFDVLLFDYRGYGHSSGRPSEQGTYRDARAARAWMLERPDVDPARVVYLGESLGAAVALELALAHRPAGLVLLSAFAGVRAMARIHYRAIPPALVPDAYPSLRLVGALRAPLLVLHGADDMIVPVEQGRALYDAAPEPKRLRVLEGVGHNDILSLAGRELAAEIAAWAREHLPPADELGDAGRSG